MTASPNDTMRLEYPAPQGSHRRAPLPAGRGWRLPAMLATAGLVVALIIGLVLAQSSPGGSPKAQAASHPVTTVHTVLVDEAKLIGLPAAVVMRKLRGAGLFPVMTHQPDGDAEPGTVLDVQPSGPLNEGSTVTVTVATHTSHHHHHHGHDGDGGGDGHGDGGGGDGGGDGGN